LWDNLGVVAFPKLRVSVVWLLNFQKTTHFSIKYVSKSQNHQFGLFENNQNQRAIGRSYIKNLVRSCSFHEKAMFFIFLEP